MTSSGQFAESSIGDGLEDDELAERRAFDSKRVAARAFQQGACRVIMPPDAARKVKFRNDLTIFDDPADRVGAIDLPGLNGERADVVLPPRLLRRDEVRERDIGAAFAPRKLLTRMLRAYVGPAVPVSFMGCYDMNRIDEVRGRAFLDKVRGAYSSW